MKEVAALVEGGRGRKRRSSLQSTRHSNRRADGRIVTSGRASLQHCLLPDRDPLNSFPPTKLWAASAGNNLVMRIKEESIIILVQNKHSAAER